MSDKIHLNPDRLKNIERLVLSMHAAGLFYGHMKCAEYKVSPSALRALVNLGFIEKSKTNSFNENVSGWYTWVGHHPAVDMKNLTELVLTEVRLGEKRSADKRSANKAVQQAPTQAASGIPPVPPTMAQVFDDAKIEDRISDLLSSQIVDVIHHPDANASELQEPMLSLPTVAELIKTAMRHEVGNVEAFLEDYVNRR